MSDEKILDRLDTRTRTVWRMVWILTSGIALALAATATAIFSGHAALVTGMSGRIVTVAFLGALFVCAFAIIGRYSIRPIKADSPRLVHGRMNTYQRNRRRSILLNVFTMFFAVVGLSPRVFQLLRAAPQMLLLLGAVITGVMLICAFLLSAGPGWQSMTPPGARNLPDDEFDSALRARTIRFGYMLVLLLLGAVFQVALWRPDWTLTALAWALYAGFALPAFYYVIADWRASRGDEG